MSTRIIRLGLLESAFMDIIIMVLLLTLAVIIYRGARRGWVLALWFVALIAVLGLFRYHVTSPLDLSF